MPTVFFFFENLTFGLARVYYIRFVENFEDTAKSTVGETVMSAKRHRNTKTTVSIFYILSLRK